MIKLIKNKIYKVTWIDTYSYHGWQSQETINERTVDLYINSVGFLIKETKLYIILALSYDSDPEFHPYAHCIWIPKGTVSKVIKLK